MLLSTLYPLCRPLLFCLNAERSHGLTLTAGRAWADICDRLHIASSPLERLDCVEHCVSMGLRFPNRVGLAAGLDKDGLGLSLWQRMGFGFVEIGTVTPRPQIGNPLPRLFRLPKAKAIINRMGFNNRGLDALVYRLQEQGRCGYQGILGINIGKNAITPLENAVDDYVVGYERVSPFGDYVVVNLSSPNTPHLRQLQASVALDPLLSRLCDVRSRLADKQGKYTPLLIKIAPDLSSTEIQDIAGLLVKHHVDGVIATNTSIQRPDLEGVHFAGEAGGLSGRPLWSLAEMVLKNLSQAIDGALPIIGVGGIFSGSDAKDKCLAGASLVQCYTGLIYQGPGLVHEIRRALSEGNIE